MKEKEKEKKVEKGAGLGSSVNVVCAVRGESSVCVYNICCVCYDCMILCFTLLQAISSHPNKVS